MSTKDSNLTDYDPAGPDEPNDSDDSDSDSLDVRALEAVRGPSGDRCGCRPGWITDRVAGAESALLCFPCESALADRRRAIDRQADDYPLGGRR